MPIPGGGRYRFKKGTDIRLHFSPSGVVNEAKNVKTGKTHSPADFRRDRARSGGRR